MTVSKGNRPYTLLDNLKSKKTIKTKYGPIHIETDKSKNNTKYNKCIKFFKENHEKYETVGNYYDIDSTSIYNKLNESDCILYISNADTNEIYGFTILHHLADKYDDEKDYGVRRLIGNYMFTLKKIHYNVSERQNYNLYQTVSILLRNIYMLATINTMDMIILQDMDGHSDILENEGFIKQTGISNDNLTFVKKLDDFANIEPKYLQNRKNKYKLLEGKKDKMDTTPEIHQQDYKKFIFHKGIEKRRYDTLY